MNSIVLEVVYVLLLRVLFSVRILVDKLFSNMFCELIFHYDFEVMLYLDSLSGFLFSFLFAIIVYYMSFLISFRISPYVVL